MRLLGRKDPLFWYAHRYGKPVTDIKWSAHQGYERHIWDGTKDPILTAWTALAEGKWAAISSGTGLGKSHDAASIVLWFLDCYENAFVITTAPQSGS